MPWCFMGWRWGFDPLFEGLRPRLPNASHAFSPVQQAPSPLQPHRPGTTKQQIPLVLASTAWATGAGCSKWQRTDESANSSGRSPHNNISWQGVHCSAGWVMGYPQVGFLATRTAHNLLSRVRHQAASVFATCGLPALRTNLWLLVCDVAVRAYNVNGAEILQVCRQTCVSLQPVFPCLGHYDERTACPAPQEH